MHIPLSLSALAILSTSVNALALPQDGVYAGNDGEWTATTPAAAVAAPSAAGGNWETQVTWPAGCQSWANPCPTDAVVAAGALPTDASSAVQSAADSVASAASSAYSNGFTSFLTQTNSYGVVTGMPSKVTSQPSVATGAVVGTASSLSSNSTGSASSSARHIVSNITASSTSSSSFTQASTTPFGSSAASATAKGSFMALALAFIVAFTL